MSRASDDRDVQATERLLAGEPLDAADGHAPDELVAFLGALREAGRTTAPTPSPELARVLREGRTAEVVPFARRRAARPMTRRALVTVALGAKIALVSAAAAEALTSAATLEPVPPAIRDAARELVGSVVGEVPWAPADTPEGVPATDGGREDGTGTGIEPDGDTPAGPGGEDPGRSGEDPGRSEDAPGRPDATADPGAPDEDGPGRPEEAPGRPDSPGQSDEHRVTPTPAKPEVPPAERPGEPGERGKAGRNAGAADAGASTSRGGAPSGATDGVSPEPYPSPRGGR